MSQIAELGIRVDSAEAVSGAENLDKLAVAGDRAEKSSVGVAAQARKAGVSIKDLGSSTQTAEQSLDRYARQAHSAGMSTQAYTAALRSVPAQFTDIFTSLQGGQSPMTVLIQQGGQLKDMFGGIGHAARALGGYVAGLVNPFTLAAGAVVGLGAAYLKGNQEADAYREALVLTGNAAGTNVGAMADLAKEVGATIGTTGAAAEVLAQLAGSNKIAGDSFGVVATAALQMRETTGRAVEETVAEFAKIGKDPVAAAKELNEQYGFLNAGVYAQIVALKEQGDTIGAAKLLTNAYAETIDSRTKEITQNLGYVERAWNAVWGASKRAGDAIFSIGRPEGIAQQLSEARTELEALEKRAKDNPIVASGAQAKADLDLARSKVATLQDQLKTQQAIDQAQENYQARQRESILSQESLNGALRATDSNAKKLQARYEEIDRQIKSSARGENGRIYTEADREQLRAAARKQFEDKPASGNAVNLSGYNDQKNALEALVATYKNSYQELEAAQRAGIISEESYVAQRKVLLSAEKEEVAVAYQAEIAALEDAKGRSSTTAAQRIQIDQKIADARSEMVKAQKDADSELAILATNEEGRLRKQALAVSTYTKALQQQVDTLRLQGQRAVSGLGMGSRQRDLMDQQNAIDDRFDQQSLNLADQYGDGSRGMSLDEYTQKLQALKDAHQSMRDVLIQNYDDISAAQGDWQLGAQAAFSDYFDSANNFAGQTQSAFTTAFSDMNDALYDFVTTGKLSFDDMASTFASTALRMLIQWGTAQVAMAALNAFTSTAAIPLIGPAAAPAAAASALGETGSFMATINSVAGMAHDGIDNIPKEGTWLLDKGERVVDSRTNSDLKRYLATASNRDSGQGSRGNLNIPIQVSVQGQPGMSEAEARRQGQLAGDGARDLIMQVIQEQQRPGGMLA